MGLGMITRRSEAPRKMKVKYKILNYIKSTGTQYADTGYTPEKGSKVEVGFRATSVNTSGECVVTGSWESDHAFRAVIYKGSFFTDECFTYSQISNKTAYTVATGNCTRTPALSMYICSAHEASGAVHTADSKFEIYYEKIWSASGTLVRDFIPVLDVDTNKAGLLDRVNYKFYPSLGSGSFVAGAATGEVIKEYVA